MTTIISDQQQLSAYLQQRTESPRRHRRLGEVLINQGHISALQLQDALPHQQAN